MEAGFFGLGKMGANMARRLLQAGHRVVVYNRTPGKADLLVRDGAVEARTLRELVQALTPPRVVWLMLPAGDAVNQAILQLLPLLVRDDIIVDGGNSYYVDTQNRAEMVAQYHLRFVDVGTSGGVWGLEHGYSLAVGGDEETVDALRPLLISLAPSPDKGWGHVGPSGAGHFVKMIHNGIEYGLMQAYAEGFSILGAKNGFGFDLHQVAQIWQHGSVVRSWLLDLTESVLSENPTLEGIAAFVPDSGEGRWTVFEAVNLDVPAPVITLALQARLRSREGKSFSDRLLAAMRNQFGGHAIKGDTE